MAIVDGGTVQSSVVRSLPKLVATSVHLPKSALKSGLRLVMKSLPKLVPTSVPDLKSGPKLITKSVQRSDGV